MYIRELFTVKRIAIQAAAAALDDVEDVKEGQRYLIENLQKLGYEANL